MRITNKLNTYNSINQVQTGMKNLYKSYNQLSSGLQIQNSYEGAGMYITNARLEYEYATLSQIEDASKLADELMKNTDSTMSEMEKLLTQFKVKVTEAANATQTPASREVIAKELETIRQQIVDLANTSVNGQFLFSGSLTNTKPFDYSGNYYGDDKRLNIVTGDGVKNAYNIPGYDLFYKADNDFKKQITTNVSFTDNRYDLVQNKDKTRYLEGKDKISYLIGRDYVSTNKDQLDKDTDFDTKPMQFPPTALYVQGVKPDGTSFKSAVLVQPTDTIQGMLNQIGALYGNTTTTKVVDVSINKSGQIQITDLKQGNTVLDFHAVAYTPQFENRESLKNAIDGMAAAQPPMSGEQLTNQVLQQVLQQVLNGNNITNLNNQPVQITIGNTQYSLNLHKTDFIFSKMTDTQNNAANGADYDNVYFETKNNKVIGNVSQVLKDGGAYATDSTKLSEVATGNLANTILNLKVSSRAGRTYDVTINLGTSTVSYTPQAGGNPVTFPIMHTDPTTLNSGVVTPTNEITYRQLNDIIGLFADDRQPTATIPTNNNQIAADNYKTLSEAFATSRVSVNVDMDYKGRITVTDRLSAGTKIKIALTDSRSGVFPNNLTTIAQTTTGSALSFSANNALIIDEPHNDLINDLETMIQAVRYGYVRADSTGEYPRNTGMQGALERLDHLNEHIIKQRTIIGADQKAMSDTKKKVMTLKVNVKSTQNEVIGADLPEVYSQLMQQQLTYQAALKASTTLSQLSLLNYM